MAPSLPAVATLLCVLAVTPGEVGAQSPWSGGGQSPLSLRLLVDARLARFGTAPSWTDRGPGKTRYGGERTATGNEHAVHFALSQLALELEASLPNQLSAHVQLNWEADVTGDGDIHNDGWPRLIEAYLRRQWGDWESGWGLQTGVLNPPFSLEQTGPAWTSRYTLTPSALNSWLWEEVRVVGVEAETWMMLRGVHADLVCGAGWGPDQAGSLLAERGWVLSDALSGINSELPLPQPGQSTSVFYERDGRPAVYAALNLSDPWKIGGLRFGYFDNLGDQGHDDVWETRFGTAGAVVRAIPKLDLIVQVMTGETNTRANRWDSTFTAWYPLLSFHHGPHRLTARYDELLVDDSDGPPASRERGDALTVAYLYQLGLRHRLGFEYIFVDSHRAAPANRDPSDGGWQVSYRYRY